MICWVCLPSLSEKISLSIGQGMRFKLVTYEGGTKQGYQIRGCASDSKSEAQFTLEHPGAAFWSHTRPEIKAQFGPRYLGAVQDYIDICGALSSALLLLWMRIPKNINI